MIKRLILAGALALVISVGLSRPVNGFTTQPPTELSRLELAGPREFTPKSYLYYIAGSDAKLLDRIVQCESGWNITAKNSQSSASGLAQFLDSTWISTRRRMGVPDDSLKLKLDWRQHIDTFVWLYKHDGTVHWTESATCWKT